MNRPRDSQKKKVYDFGKSVRAILPTALRPMTVPAMQELANRVTTSLGAKHIRLRFSKGHRRGYAYTLKRLVTIPRWGADAEYVLHEVAHVLHRDAGWSGHASHGPEYVGHFFALLEDFTGIDSERLHELLHKHRVKMQPLPGRSERKLIAAGSTEAARLILRRYKGVDHVISIKGDAFHYEGQTFSSATALAKHITGYRSINGKLWLGLKGE